MMKTITAENSQNIVSQLTTTFDKKLDSKVDKLREEFLAINEQNMNKLRDEFDTKLGVTNSKIENFANEDDEEGFMDDDDEGDRKRRRARDGKPTS